MTELGVIDVDLEVSDCSLNATFVKPWMTCMESLLGYQALIEEVIDFDSVISRANANNNAKSSAGTLTSNNKLWRDK